MPHEHRLKIEKNTVQETLLLPLYGRVKANERYPRIFPDSESAKVMEKIEFSQDRADLGESSYVMYGIRHQFSVACAREYLAERPEATIVDIGCGMDILMPYIDNGTCRMVNLDLPDVIDLRNQLIPAREREINLAHDALDLAWIDKIDADPSKGLLAVSSGVFYYFHPEDVRRLFCAMADRFPEGRLQFDAESRFATEQSNKKVKQHGNTGAEMYFGIDDAEKELMPWSDKFKSVHVSTAKELAPYLNGVSFKVRAFLVLGVKIGLFKFIRIDFA